MKTILILDDEQAVRQSFVDYFEDQMWQPIQAGSGEDALLLLDKYQPTAAIVDVRLPGMDGHDFIRKACKQGVSMAFVICTGSPEYILPNDLQALSSVSNHLFRKPVSDFSELEMTLVQTIKALENGAEDE